MLTKRLLSIFLLISVLGNFFLMYRVLDLGVTTTYQESEIALRIKQMEAMERLFPALVASTSRSQLLDAAEKLELETFDKGSEGVNVGGIMFIFSDNRVSAVDFY